MLSSCTFNGFAFRTYALLFGFFVVGLGEKQNVGRSSAALGRGRRNYELQGAPFGSDVVANPLAMVREVARSPKDAAAAAAARARILSNSLALL